MTWKFKVKLFNFTDVTIIVPWRLNVDDQFFAFACRLGPYVVKIRPTRQRPFDIICESQTFGIPLFFLLLQKDPT